MGLKLESLCTCSCGRLGKQALGESAYLGNPERRMILQDTIVGVGRSHGDEITVRNVQEGFDVRSFSPDFTQVGCDLTSHCHHLSSCMLMRQH